MLRDFKSDRLETKHEQFGLLFFCSYQLILQHCFSLILRYGKWGATQITPVKVSETSNIATSELVGRRYLLSKIHIS